MGVQNNVFSRTYDQDQWARASGPTSLFPRVDGGLAGIVFFAEPVTFRRMLFLSTLIVSVVGLQVVNAE